MFDMEKNFCEFLDSSKYDRAEQWLFDIVRSAYLSGWDAAMNAQNFDKQPSPPAAPPAVISLQEIKE